MDDIEAIASDWRAVGDDLRQSIIETALRRGVSLELVIADDDVDPGPLPPPAWLERLEQRSPGSSKEAFQGMTAISRRRREEEKWRAAKPPWTSRLANYLKGIMAVGRRSGNVSPETRRALDNPATRYRIVDAWRYLNRGGKPKARRRTR